MRDPLRSRIIIGPHKPSYAGFHLLTSAPPDILAAAYTLTEPPTAGTGAVSDPIDLVEEEYNGPMKLSADVQLDCPQCGEVMWLPFKLVTHAFA